MRPCQAVRSDGLEGVCVGGGGGIGGRGGGGQEEDYEDSVTGTGPGPDGRSEKLPAHNDGHFRGQKCERGRGLGLPVPNSAHSLCGRKTNDFPEKSL